MWQLGETRFWKKNGVVVSEEDQLLELGSCGADLILASIIFMIFQLKWSKMCLKMPVKLSF